MDKVKKMNENEIDKKTQQLFTILKEINKNLEKTNQILGLILRQLNLDLWTRNTKPSPVDSEYANAELEELLKKLMPELFSLLKEKNTSGETKKLCIYQIFPEGTIDIDIEIIGLLAVDSPLTGEELENIGKIVHQEKQNEEWSYDILQHKIKNYLKKHRKILKIKKFDMFI